MERYHKDDESLKRTYKNSKLYNEIYDNKSYDNVEDLNMNVGKEIDIRDVKAMLEKRESYNDIRDYRIVKPLEERRRVTHYEIDDDTNSHDINEMLELARTERPVEERRRSLDETQILTLQELVSQKKYAKKTSLNNDDVKDLINTIYDTNLLKSDDGAGLLDNLMPTGKTVLSPDIKKVLEEAKKNDTKEMDKSFFTSSLGFKAKDLESTNSYSELDESNEKTNRFLFVLGVIFILVVLFIIIKFAF